MPKQMWFGNENRFQWVPAPASGISVSNTGYAEQLDLQQGRVSIYRTHQTHKEYGLEFPVQEAGGLEGLDVFSRYAQGLYGHYKDYPCFFADLMHYDQNLFPAGWASPGLFKQGWDQIAEHDPKTYYNLATNPSVETGTTNYAVTAGTSGVANGTQSTTASAIVSGAYCYQVTWTTGTSAVSGGAKYLDTPVTAGKTYDFGAYVTTSKIQRVRLLVRWRNSLGSSISTVSGTQTVTAATTPVLLSVLATTAPANAVTADIEIDAVTGTSGTNWAIADWLAVDAVTIAEPVAHYPTYFDGSFPLSGWLGTAHASASYLYLAKSSPTISATATNSFQVPTLSATYNITSAPNAYPTAGNTLGAIPYAIIPIPPGYTLHMGATGSATGTAQVTVHLFNAPGNPASPALATSLTLLSATGSTRLNASWSGSSYQYAKVFLSRTSTAASTITLSSMMAQLWPTGYSPTLTGNFIPGQGHLGLMFADNANVESYQIVDMNRNVPIHYKGLSTRLVEAQE